MKLSVKAAKSECGFTLIEAMVALLIASTALVVLMGRLGSSADIQYGLSMHTLVTEQAMNKMAELSMQTASLSEQEGTVEIGDIQLDWRSWSEQTMLDGFVRVNVSMQLAGESEVTLFIYREI